MDDKEKHDILFTQLVLMFHSATMAHLGKVKNAITDKIERNLPAAQETIDILEMLHSKTKGNLSSEESRMLTNVLTEVKLNFVDEVNKRPESQTQTSEGHEQP